MIRTGLVVSAAAVAVMTATWMWMSRSLPADVGQLPIHWGLDGQPDRFASRDDALATYALLPAAGVGLALLLAVLPSIEPLKTNLMRGQRAYLTAWIGAEMLLALVAVGIAMLTVRGEAGDANTEFVRWIIAGVGVLFVFLGDALPKTRPNFFVGVRTPWTLSSDLSWQKTHRLAGWAFVLIGLWGIVAAFTLKGLALAFSLTAPLLVSVAFCAVYSWVVWKNDPDKRAPGQRPIAH